MNYYTAQLLWMFWKFFPFFSNFISYNILGNEKKRIWKIITILQLSNDRIITQAHTEFLAKFYSYSKSQLHPRVIFFEWVRVKFVLKALKTWTTYNYQFNAKLVVNTTWFVAVSFRKRKNILFQIFRPYTQSIIYLLKIVCKSKTKSWLTNVYVISLSNSRYLFQLFWRLLLQ